MKTIWGFWPTLFSNRHTNIFVHFNKKNFKAYLNVLPILFVKKSVLANSDEFQFGFSLIKIFTLSCCWSNLFRHTSVLNHYTIYSIHLVPIQFSFSSKIIKGTTTFNKIQKFSVYHKLHYFFLLLWKGRCYILVTFLSHL